MDLLAIERRFSNLADLWENRAVQVITFDDPYRSEAFYRLVTLQKILRLNSENFEQISRLLSYIHWDLRGFVGSPEATQSKWTARRDELTYELSIAKSFFDEVATRASIDLIGSFEKLVDFDSFTGKALIDCVGTSSALIVVERDRQRDLVTRFFEDTGVDFQGDVVQMQTLFRLEVVDYDDIVLLAAPKRISDNYMRALLLGGVTPKAKFLCSNWLAGHEPQKVEQDLLPGLPGVKKLAFNVVGPPLSSTFQSISQEEFEEFQILPLASDFEKFSGGGAVPCRLIQLANGHVMPVELKAKKVSVLKTNDDGEFTVEYRTPGKDLEAGDILFELRDGAEEDFLMDQAQISMGKAFHEFSKGRSDWKRRVGDLIAAHGKGNVIRQLKAAGVGTAKYLDDWLGNVDFTTPRAKKDWHNLLVALKFAPSEISRLEALGKDLRAKLIAVGLKARSHMADAVDSTELSAIRNREIVTKQLDGFGDAVFILAMVEDPDAGASTCEQHEIRKVLKA